MVNKLVLVGASIAALAVPGTASASIRYTSPTGSGTTCSQAAPCQLSEGVSGSSAGDEVRLTADEYNLTTQLHVTTPNLTISGPPGRYSPSDFRAFVIFDGGAISATNVLVDADGLTLERVSIVGESGLAPLVNVNPAFSGLRLDRVSVTDRGSTQSVKANDAQVVNSVIRQSSGTYAAVNVTGSITGSTIYSNQIAVLNDGAFHVGYCDLQVLNTIAVGAVRNLAASPGSGGACTTSNVNYDYSWIPSAPGYGGGGVAASVSGATITRGPDNIADSPPALAAPLGGEINLVPGSPAVNAGCGVSCGTEDFYGRPRPIGSGNDIGATETILPPRISNLSVGTVQPTSAPVSATVNPNGGAGAYNFQVRPAGSSEWGSFDGAATGEGTADQAVAGTARPLDPSTDYELRVVAANSAGESASPVAAFRTPAAPASVAVSHLKSRTSRRSAYLTSRASVNGAGTVSQSATTGSGRRKRTWCRVSRRATGAGTVTLKCNLGSKGRRYLRKRPLKLKVKTRFVAASGTSASVTRSLTVKRRR